MNEADSFAAAILARARLDHGGPVDPRELARALGVFVIPTAPRVCGGSWDGLAVRTTGDPRILMHELAHCGLVLTGMGMPHDERFVASVASCLMAPRDLVRRAIRQNIPAAALARSIGVAESCTVVRYAEVTNEPMALVTPTHVRLRGDWYEQEHTLRRAVKVRPRWAEFERLTDDPRRVVVRPRRR